MKTSQIAPQIARQNIDAFRSDNLAICFGPSTTQCKQSQLDCAAKQKQGREDSGA
jgi:hypothetical protein